MIRAQRRYVSDVGGCMGCTAKHEQVTCVGVIEGTTGVELRLCDHCLSDLLATAVKASNAPPRATRSIVGSAPDTPSKKTTSATASTATKWKPKTKQAKPRKPPKPYPAKKPEVRAGKA